MSCPFGSFGRGLEGWQEEWDQGDKPKHVILPNFNKSRQYWSFEKVRERKSTLLQPESISTNQHKPTSIIINQHQHPQASIGINQGQSKPISINQHQSTSININQHQSASASTSINWVRGSESTSNSRGGNSASHRVMT